MMEQYGPLNIIDQVIADHKTCKLCGSALQSINHTTFADLQKNQLVLRIPTDYPNIIYQESNFTCVYIDIKENKIIRYQLDQSFGTFQYYQSLGYLWFQINSKIALEEYIMTLMCPNYHYTINTKFKLNLEAGFFYGAYISDESFKFIGNQETSVITNDYSIKKTIYTISGKKFYNKVYDLLAPNLDDPEKVLKRCQILETFS